MDFKFVLEKILKSFQEAEVRYALMGGFALGVWGVHRATADIDFLIHRDDIGAVDKIAKTLGYRKMFHTENVSQYVSDQTLFGELDFLHAFREIAVNMLQRAEERTLFEGALRIKVLRPEDLIGLKVQAMANNPARHANDMADIEALLKQNTHAIDWPLVQSYFTLFEMQGPFLELKRKYHEHK